MAAKKPMDIAKQYEESAKKLIERISKMQSIVEHSIMNAKRIADNLKAKEIEAENEARRREIEQRRLEALEGLGNAYISDAEEAKATAQEPVVEEKPV